MNKNIPLYKVVVNENDDTGMFKISLVERPAIEETFIHLSEEQAVFKFADNEKRQVVGPIIIPDKPIYRRNESLGEYYVVFTQETIERMMKKYSKGGLFNAFNLEHSIDTQDVLMLEMWMKEGDQDKSNLYGFNLPVGTVFAKAQIESEAIWEEVKKNNLNGFSIEIKSDIVEQKMSNQMDLNFAVEIGQRLANIEAMLAKVSSDHEQVTNILEDLDSRVSEMEHIANIPNELEEQTQEALEEQAPEKVEEQLQEETQEENQVEESLSQEPVAESVEEELSEVQETVEEVQEELAEQTQEEAPSVEEAELALSSEQEETQEVKEAEKVLSFSAITKEKINLIDKFFGNRLY